ncbi:hypothetical protein HNY73_016225 [Argiope bruennichi]|uniref:Uncharacterized protein n=1 Tax=Argiope bruennichi TaxID=94029 RepID=A0A8T0EJC3_ARGBR|nr:hypothetical protein HNY73_016225 [Argiope bruennichi]
MPSSDQFPASSHNLENVLIHKDLPNSSHVFVLVRTTEFAVAYNRHIKAPYKVLSKSDKLFKLLMNGKSSFINVDRLKPAFLLASEHEPPTAVGRSKNQYNNTRFGRKVRFRIDPKINST